MKGELARLSPDCRTVVFVGPTLHRAEAQEILPEAVILPPVRFGDLYSLIASEIDMVVIIDGVFHGQPPVWQREIAAALARGMCVVGAASMGALRALELAPYGMIGIGEVVRWYREGRIEGDDEVALLHADEEMNYLPLSIPLVDVRAALDNAVVNGELGRKTATSIASKLKELCHAERTRDMVLAITEDEGAGQTAKAALAARLGQGYSGLKAQDARSALRICRTPGKLAAANELEPGNTVWVSNPPVEPLESVMMRAACRNDGRRFRLSEILQQAKRNEADCERRLRDEACRWFLIDWCSMAETGPDERELADFAIDWLDDHGAGNPDVWLRESGLHTDELQQHLVGRCIEAWLEAQSPAALPLASAAGQHPIIVQILADWARRMQVTAPDEASADTSTVAEWLVQSTPGFFGAISWHPDRALVESLQVDGEVARLAGEISLSGSSDGQ